MEVYSKKIVAFTLAEVLIALVVIGIVVAMTIPGFIQNVEKDQYANLLKNDYNAISQAFAALAEEKGHGSIKNVPGFSSPDGSDADDVTALNQFATKISGLKICNSNMGCIYNTPIKTLGGSTFLSGADSNWGGFYGKAILTNGSMIVVNIYGNNCSDMATSGPQGDSICGNVMVDVNGTRGPNTLGRDVFFLWITATGIYPYGMQGDGHTCDVASTVEWTSSCGAKVLSEGAMNY